MLEDRRDGLHVYGHDLVEPVCVGAARHAGRDHELVLVEEIHPRIVWTTNSADCKMLARGCGEIFTGSC